MRPFRAEKDVRMRIRGLLADGEFLWTRNLYKRAAKVFLQAKAQALKIEDQLALLEISRWERRFPQYIRGMSYENTTKDVLAEQIQFLDHLNQEFQYRALYDRLVQPLRQRFRRVE